MSFPKIFAVVVAVLAWPMVAISQSPRGKVGQEVAVPVHMQDGEEYQARVRDLVAYGKKLFTAAWTIQEGAGRPMSKGTGMMLSDLRDPLLFPRNFNRISGPDANSC